MHAGTIRILVCGSNQLLSPYRDTAIAFGVALAKCPRLNCLTGGTMSIDGCVTYASSYYAASAMAGTVPSREHRVRRMMTIIPELDDEYVIRESFGCTICPRQLDRRARQYQLVGNADAILVLGGDAGTRQLLRLAHDKPILPVPHTGGTAEEYWSEYRDEVCDRFRLTKAEAHRIPALSTGPAAVADFYVDILTRQCAN